MAAITLPQPSGHAVPKLWEPLKVRRRLLAARVMRARVRMRDFSIVSNDCWGGMAYEELGMRYESPFVGLFIVPEDYIRLLRDLRKSVTGELTFRHTSRHPEINRWREQIQRQYPIGLIGDDVEVHFLHYKTEPEARSKWRRRAERILWDKLRVKMSWHDHPKIDAWLREFDGMDFSAKLILAPYTVGGTRHCVAHSDFSTDGTQQYWRAHKAFDVAAWLEAGTLKRYTLTRPLDWMLYWHY
jgi:uncharacterized protein (DUF1919 family)